MDIIKQVVGIDVSMDNLIARFGTIDAKQNQDIKAAKEFANNRIGHKELIKWADKNKLNFEVPIWFVMEATGVYYENLAFHLAENKQNIAVILPNKIKNFSRTLDSKSKTDSIDSATITQFGLEKQLKQWQTSPEVIRQLKTLCREYHTLKELSVQVSNQVHAKQNSYKPEQNTLRRLSAKLKLFSKQQIQIIGEIHKLIDQQPEIKERIAKIDKIEGVGFITIVSIIAETNGFAIIDNQKQLTSYAGLDIVHNESGLKKHKTSISKKGNKHLRRSLYMPALTACRYNQKLKELYIRLVIKKNNKKIALIAVARKLLLLIYTIWKKNIDYIPDYQATRL
jgi:transposase